MNQEKSLKNGFSMIVKRNKEELYLLIFIVAILAISPIFSDVFFTPYNLFNLLRQISYTAIAAVGMLFAILIGGIDLSVGAVMSAVGLSSILLLQAQVPIWLTVAIILILGAVIGLANGLLITFGRLQPFIVTLVTKIIIEGIILVVTDGGGVAGGIDQRFTEIGAGYIGPFPTPVIIMIAILIISGWVLAKTVFGRQVYAMGSNKTAAHNSGINTKRIQVLAFMICGLCGGIAGLLMISRTGAFQPTTTHGGATGMELNAIAAVVVGGGSLSGGKGNVFGAFLGALLSGLLFNLLVLLNINPYIQQLILGLIILVAVVLSASDRRKTR